MCSGRVDLEFIFRAFSNGQDGVFIGGCRLGECNYITHGNYGALSTVYIGKKMLTLIGIDPQRLRIEFMSGAEGQRLAEVCDDFTGEVRQLGPLGKPEGLSAETLKFKLEAVNKLVPFVKLVERERLRVPLQSAEAYQRFFDSEDVNRIFRELLADKLSVSQILLLLRQEPLSTGRIAERLRLNPVEVAKHLRVSSRQGFVRYDQDRKCYGLA